MRLGIFTALLFCLVVSGTCLAEGPLPAVGAAADTGCGKSPQKVQRLQISKAGTYENYLVDGRWVERNLVKITSSKVILRNSEIRNGRHNAVAVYSDDVLIEGCRIHHLLAGTFAEQKDAHGVTGRPGKLTIRNCEIYLVSGIVSSSIPAGVPGERSLLKTAPSGPAPCQPQAPAFEKERCRERMRLIPSNWRRILAVG